MLSHPPETHRTSRIGWLRAAVLGANDGIVSTGSLVVGVAAAEATRSSVLVAGIARLVAQQLTSHDALGAHARDELGISAQTTARPLQAALASAGAFAVGAGVPLFAMVLSPAPLIPSVVGASMVCLAALGALAGRVG